MSKASDSLKLMLHNEWTCMWYNDYLYARPKVTAKLGALKVCEIGRAQWVSSLKTKS